ncbi:hypothetical protein VNI00_002044 [Paramarasmius palmivorus]|uniref:Uncharacterized protein n=1 Tax=Paramarasmius palmivorus TaxID=297713 RepID=A0AAW0E221_9AGAR
MEDFPEDGAFRGPQRFPLSSLPVDLQETFDDPGAIESEDAITTLDLYLRASGIPGCLRFGRYPIDTVPQFMTPWPENPELKRPLGTRVLQKAVTHDKWDFARSVRRYLDELPDLMIRVAHTGPLKLPASAIAEYDEDDVEKYSHVDGVDELLEVLKDTIFETVAECIRVIERIPRSAALCETLSLIRANELCRAHHARWDILAMLAQRGLMPGDLIMAVIVVPPWEMNLDSFRQFTAPRDFSGHMLDIIPSSPADSISDKLWVAAYDCCYRRGRYFIVTNYTHWAFGHFKKDWTAAHITEPIEAKKIELENNGVTYAADNGANVVESLLYWIQLARGSVTL